MEIDNISFFLSHSAAVRRFLINLLQRLQAAAFPPPLCTVFWETLYSCKLQSASALSDVSSAHEDVFPDVRRASRRFCLYCIPAAVERNGDVCLTCSQPTTTTSPCLLTLQSCVFQEVGGILRKCIFDKFLSGVTRQPHWFNTVSEASQSGFSKVTLQWFNAACFCQARNEVLMVSFLFLIASLPDDTRSLPNIG